MIVLFLLKGYFVLQMFSPFKFCRQYCCTEWTVNIFLFYIAGISGDFVEDKDLKKQTNNNNKKKNRKKDKKNVLIKPCVNKCISVYFPALEQAPQSSGCSPKLPEFKKHLDNALRHGVWISGGAVQSWGLDSSILVRFLPTWDILWLYSVTFVTPSLCK